MHEQSRVILRRHEPLRLYPPNFGTFIGQVEPLLLDGLQNPRKDQSTQKITREGKKTYHLLRFST